MWTRPPGAASRARSASEPRLLPAEQQELEHYAAGVRRTRRQPGCCTRQTQCREGGPHSEIRGTAPPFALAAQHSTGRPRRARSSMLREATYMYCEIPMTSMIRPRLLAHLCRFLVSRYVWAIEGG